MGGRRKVTVVEPIWKSTSTRPAGGRGICERPCGSKDAMRRAPMHQGSRFCLLLGMTRSWPPNHPPLTLAFYGPHIPWHTPLTHLEHDVGDEALKREGRRGDGRAVQLREDGAELDAKVPARLRGHGCVRRLLTSSKRQGRENSRGGRTPWEQRTPHHRSSLRPRQRRSIRAAKGDRQ